MASRQELRGSDVLTQVNALDWQVLECRTVVNNPDEDAQKEPGISCEAYRLCTASACILKRLICAVIKAVRIGQ